MSYDNSVITSKNVELILLGSSLRILNHITKEIYFETKVGKDVSKFIDKIESILILLHRSTDLRGLSIKTSYIGKRDLGEAFRFHNNRSKGPSGHPYMLKHKGNLYVLDGTHRINQKIFSNKGITAKIVTADLGDFNDEHYTRYSADQINTDPCGYPCTHKH